MAQAQDRDGYGPDAYGQPRLGRTQARGQGRAPQGAQGRATQDIFRSPRDAQGDLRAQGLAAMLVGAGYAGAVVLAVLLFFALLIFLGRLLPEDSKTAPDPLQRSDAVMIEAARDA